MRFGDPGNPVKEECKWRNTNLLSSPVVFWGQRGWVLGLQFRDWRVGGGQNHHTGLTRGHMRDGGSHRVDVGVALGGGSEENGAQIGRQATPGVTHSSAAAGQLAGAGDGMHTWRPSACAGGRVAPRTSRADHSPEPDLLQSCLVGGGGGARPAPSFMPMRQLAWAHQQSHPYDSCAHASCRMGMREGAAPRPRRWPRLCF